MTPRLPCRAVLLDAGGVIVLPDRKLLAGALSHVGIGIDPARSHAPTTAPSAPSIPAPALAYSAALFLQLGIIPGQTAEALAAWDRLADRSRSGEIIWSEPTPGALETIAALRRRGLPVVIVTNSDGQAEENLRDCGFAGVPVIDSVVVGSEKPRRPASSTPPSPAPATWQSAPRDVGRVGDTLSTPTSPAPAPPASPRSTSSPLRACRAPDHRHVRRSPESGACTSADRR